MIFMFHQNLVITILLLEEWGDLLKQRAAPSGKRIQLLHRIQTIVKTPQKSKQSLKTKYDKAENKTEKHKLKTKLKSLYK